LIDVLKIGVDGIQLKFGELRAPNAPDIYLNPRSPRCHVPLDKTRPVVKFAAGLEDGYQVSQRKQVL
jgi:hypothetical protein